MRGECVYVVRSQADVSRETDVSARERDGFSRADNRRGAFKAPLTILRIRGRDRAWPRPSNSQRG